jgi:ABC-type multidrug transport system fused ATPase/permease subunit
LKDYLDADYTSETKYVDFPNDKVLWRGKPAYRTVVRFLETNNHYKDVVTKATSPMIVYLILTFFISYGFVITGHVVLPIVFFLFCLVAPFVYEEIRNKNLKKMEYMITSKYVIIKEVRMFKKEIHRVSLDRIAQLNVVSYNDTRDGSIYLYTDVKYNFKTVHGKTHDKQSVITLELLRDYKAVFALLSELTKNNKVSVPRYSPAMIDSNTAKYTAYVFSALLMFCVIWLMNFYLIADQKSFYGTGGLSNFVVRVIFYILIIAFASSNYILTRPNPITKEKYTQILIFSGFYIFFFFMVRAIMQFPQ